VRFRAPLPSHSSISKGKAEYAAAQAQLKALQSSYNALEKTVTMRYKAT
jgi:hypothetical protein